MSKIALTNEDSDLVMQGIDYAILYNKEKLQFGTMRKFEALKRHIDKQRTIKKEASK